MRLHRGAAVRRKRHIGVYCYDSKCRKKLPPLVRDNIPELDLFGEPR